MFLVIGAILLFALLTLNVNRTVLQSESQQRSAEYIVMATSAAQNLMKEISSKSFDEGTLTLPIYSSDILTLANLLGPESGEVYGNCDDDGEDDDGEDDDDDDGEDDDDDGEDDDDDGEDDDDDDEDDDDGNCFDDIDDYNLFTRAESNLRGGTFNLKVWVDYVNDNNFDVVMSTKTRSKRIKIAVENPFMADTLYLYNYKYY